LREKVPSRISGEANEGLRAKRAIIITPQPAHCSHSLATRPLGHPAARRLLSGKNRLIFLSMPPPHVSPSIVRIGVRPDEPGAVVGPRPKKSRRPHADATVAAVRRLIEQTPLTYGEIAAKTGVARASICRWTRNGGWQRPLFAPRATDTVPRVRASAHLKARTLFARLSALAERTVRELEESTSVDLEKLGEALELLKMAKLAARPRRRKRSDDAGDDATHALQRGAEDAAEGSPRAVLRGLRAAGVRVERAPEEALEDFIASRAPPPDVPKQRPRGHRSTRNRDHARMLERDRG
jgi:hypothetical protein